MSARPSREEWARILHLANTGRITPDPDDPTRYAAMAAAVLERLAAEPVLGCVYCLRPAHTIRYGQAICGMAACAEKSAEYPRWIGLTLAAAAEAWTAGGAAVKTATEKLRRATP